MFSSPSLPQAGFCFKNSAAEKAALFFAYVCLCMAKLLAVVYTQVQPGLLFLLR